MSAHYIVKCSCGKVIAQSLCSGAYRSEGVSVIKNSCPKCKCEQEYIKRLIAKWAEEDVIKASSIMGSGNGE